MIFDENGKIITACEGIDSLKWIKELECYSLARVRGLWYSIYMWTWPLYPGRSDAVGTLYYQNFLISAFAKLNLVCGIFLRVLHHYHTSLPIYLFTNRNTICLDSDQVTGVWLVYALMFSHRIIKHRKADEEKDDRSRNTSFTYRLFIVQLN